MTQEHPPADVPPLHVRLLADLDTWRHVALATALGLLALPAATMVLVALLVLAVQGAATWLVVVAVALVSTLLGGTGAAVALRRGHRGVVHRLAVLAAVWGVAVVVLAITLALSLDGPERAAVGALLVLGGTHTLVLGLGLGGAARVMPAPVVEAAPEVHVAASTVDEVHVAASTVDEVPTPASAPDNDELADWPAWGGGTEERTRVTAPEVDAQPAADAQPETAVEPPAGPRPGRSTAPRSAPVRSAGQPRTTGTRPAAPTRPASAARSTSARPGGGDAVPRRTTTTGRTTPARRGAGADGPATERLARAVGDDGPPTQRIPPVVP